MTEFQATMPTILCCMCGTDILQNPSNMCVTCLRSSVDITAGIPRQLTIHSCRSCERFLCPPWQKVQLESKELMAACLRKIPGLSKVKLIDAVWIWTEPHSLRLHIKLTIQKEVMNGAILQQAALVEFTVRNQQCKDCQQDFATGSWHAVVQVRQRVTHKRTFYYLEQLLLKHNAHSDCLNIVTFRDGMDFYFTEKQKAVRFIDFLESHVPTKVKYSRKLISADHSANIGEFKHNFIVELVPLCKDDLVILPKELARNLSDISPLVLVKAVSAGVHVVDPFTGERQEINTEKYWRYNFPSLMSSREIEKYVVLSVEPMLSVQRASAKRRGLDKKMRLAECVVAREKDLGVNDTQHTVVTNLGHILKEGDTVFGYDLIAASWAHEEEASRLLTRKELPDIVLVRKCYKTKGERRWLLKSMQYDETAPQSNKEQAAAEGDYEAFLEQLEGDKEMRAHVNLYKGGQTKKTPTMSKGAVSSGSKMETNQEGTTDDAEDDNDDDEEKINLTELLDEMMLTGAATETTEDVTGDSILTAEQAAQIAGIHLSTTGFEAADFAPTDFKFT